MRQRYVSGRPGAVAEGNADDTRLHCIERSGLGVKCKERRLLEPLDPCSQRSLIEDNLVCRRWLVVRRVGAAKFGQPGLELEVGVEFPQRLFVGGDGPQAAGILVERHITLDGSELPGQRQLLQRCAQVFTCFATHLVGMGDQLVQ